MPQENSRFDLTKVAKQLSDLEERENRFKRKPGRRENVDGNTKPEFTRHLHGPRKSLRLLENKHEDTDPGRPPYAPSTSSPLASQTVVKEQQETAPETTEPSAPAQGHQMMDSDDGAPEYTGNIHGVTEPERTKNISANTESPTEPSSSDMSSLGISDD